MAEEFVTVQQMELHFDPLMKSMADLQDTLENVKTQGERMEAIEKQLKDAERINEERRQKVPVFSGAEKVQRDIFHENMTVKEVDFALRSPTEDPLVHEFQEWSDTLKIYCSLLGQTGQPLQPRDLKIYPQWEEFCQKSGLGKALSVAGSPTSWNPEAWASDVQTFYQQALRVATLFDEFPMPQDPFNWPFLGTGFTVKQIGEPTKEPISKVAASKPSQSTIILSTATIGGRVLLTEKLEEDAIAALVPTLRTNIIPRGMAEGVEDAIVNGDTASTHQDAGVAGDDVRKTQLGIRAIAIDESATYDVTTGSTVFAYSDFKEVLKKQTGGFSADPTEGAWVMSNASYLDATDFDAVKDNPQLVQAMVSPVLNGVVNVIHGRPVIVSPKYPETLDANGVVVSGQTKTGFTHVNHRQFVIGTRRQETIDQEFDIEERVWKIVVTKRLVFKQTIPTGNKTCGSGINA